MLGLIETIDQLAMASSFHWHDHLSRREHGHVLIRALDCVGEGQGRNGG